jgi:hypothetical protein
MTRNCLGCGQQDDHPRHVTDTGDWHLDCHARSGQGCELCEAATDSHDGELKGDDLRAHLVENDPAGPVAERLNNEAVAAAQSAEG